MSQQLGKGKSAGGKLQRERVGKRGRGSASPFPKHGNPKQVANDSVRIPPKAIFVLSKVAPSDDTFLLWVQDLRQRLGVVALRSLGVPAPVVLRGKVPCSPARRVVFYLWSALFCPSNLSNAFHLATWGRFNRDMPQDYRAAALRLIDRKGGPSRARLEGRPYQPFRKPWQGKVARRMIYVVPPSLPLL